jgi:hypothetical protein
MPSRPPRRIEKPFLLLCEGAHDRHFFDQLLQHRSISDFMIASNYGISGISGNSAFGNSLSALTAITDFDRLRGIVLVTDSDLDPQHAFDNVQQQIIDAAEILGPSARKYPVPTAALDIAFGHPALVVITIPDIKKPGNLETFMLEAVQSEAPLELHCVQQFSQCVGAEKWPVTGQSKLLMKALVISKSKNEPDISLAKIWESRETNQIVPLQSRVFNPFCVFLRHFCTEVLRNNS